MPVCICTAVAVIISSVRIYNQGIEGLNDKSNAILTLNIMDFVEHHQDGSSISEIEHDDKLMEGITYTNDSSAQYYEFKICSQNPENTKHLPNTKEMVFINKFIDEKVHEISHIDKETNSLWVMKPVFMNKSKGCLECHSQTVGSENQSMSDLRGMFMVKSELKHVQDQIQTSVFLIIIFGFIIMTVAIILGVVIVKKITTALNQIVSTSKKISEGDLTELVNINTRDELEELGSYINSMINSLSWVLLSVRETANDMANATEQISRTSSTISQESQFFASQIEELNSTFRNTSDNTKSVNEFIDLTRFDAMKAGKSITQTVESMNKIKISSARIVKVIKMINDISLQTRLLSTNASIVAKKAGEHGKGFSVVATEVNKLSEQSTNSAKDISEISKVSLDKIGEGVEIASKASLKIDKIIDSMSKISELMKEISQATGEQSSIIDSNSGIINNNAVASEQLNASVVSLDQRANSLKELVANFQLQKQ